MSIADEVLSAINMVRASERLLSMVEPLKTLTSTVSSVMTIQPELAPELEQILERVAELADHVLAAQAVIDAKFANLNEGGPDA